MTVAAVFIILAFAGCGNTDKKIFIKKPEKKELRAVSSVATEEGYQLMAFLETDGDHFIDVKVESGHERGVVEIRDENLALVSAFRTRRGMGPGEFMAPSYFFIDGEKVHMLDGHKNTVEIFDYEGNNVDTVLLGNTISIFKWITSCIYDGSSYYIAPLIPDIAVKFGKDGNGLSSVKSHLKDNADGLMWQEHACRLARDTDGNIYVSYNERGYEIDKYDSDLNPVWTASIADRTMKKPGMSMTVIGDAKQPVGTFTHSSFFWKDGKLFVLRGVGGEIKAVMKDGRKTRESGKIEGIKNPFMDVFDAGDCSFLYRIEIPFLSTDSWAEVVPVGDSFVFSILSDDDESDYNNSVCKAVFAGE